ncbi:cytidylate kinase [Aquiflexum balticum DSM 16537]|uniref:Cytidylate kinase n=1 Tax=Aquiflexum balticum DSM 16537 TaxID=758820 RepID=A0A1W2H2P7_9BACT|nr:(d)CMP kinase [Aquiflexum balticum]SMD43139.1 cytidylate kinase [Aquiflexum balticum DSM 16537]
MQRIVIAIDGYSGCGKSSTAKAVAKILNYTYIDSGAMYRAATLHFLNNHVTLTNPKDVERNLENLQISFHVNPESGQQETFLNGINVEDEIRSMKVSEYVSEVSKIKEVRTALVAQQQHLGRKKGVVMDGRDISTVVFPQAELKIFMNADLKIRAERRQKELLEKGTLIELDKIIQNLSERDKMDSSREESPLIKAEDAKEIDTSRMDFNEQVNQIVKLAKEKIGN